MTYYQSLELALCFGVSMGWVVSSLIIIGKELVCFIRGKVKARREKKAGKEQPDEE